MRLLSKGGPFRKGAGLYRRICHRKGFGVHSPFVFSLITKVIEESCPYYAFDGIEMERRKLLQRMEQLTYPDRRQKNRLVTRPLCRIARREAISRKQGMLLFRLANYFHSKQIIQLGPSMGISTLYLTSHMSGVKCIAIENIPGFARIASGILERAGRNPVDLRVGDYRELFPEALVDMEKVDFVFFNTLHEGLNNVYLFEEALKYVQSDTILVYEGIRQNSEMRNFWKEICCRPEVTVTMDLYSMGLVFFDPKLHKRNYKTYL